MTDKAIELAPEVYVRPPQNPAMSEIRTAETDTERAVKTAVLTKSSTMNVDASAKYRNAESSPKPIHILSLVAAAALLYMLFFTK